MVPQRSETGYELVVVANRLPVDRVEMPDGGHEWRQSPGGLVTALEPVMRAADGAWVGWSGAAGDSIDAFDHSGMHLAPVSLSETEVAEYYEGFSNGTLWPLYHDVIAPPEFHRHWWETYVKVNQRFADAAGRQAARGATVWVQDYQLQLVPAMLREQRPDLRIGFFNHIPFPPYEIFAQLPWRRQVVRGLLGADLLGFQRVQDANNFLRAAKRAVGLSSRGHRAEVTDPDSSTHTVRATAFPISIDSKALDKLSRSEAVAKRADQIRNDLGNPGRIILGVDRLDYTKGIAHRLKAFGELLVEGRIDASDTVLVQVATPSRERVDHYRLLREEIELAVGRINGDYGSLGRPAVHYLHHSYPRDEMAALFQVADVMLVTSLRDGMNLVAKEYVASRYDERGVLVLSEFTGAADELVQALMVNPHDVDGVKYAIEKALSMPVREQARRMRALRRRVMENDVQRWADRYLAALQRPEGGVRAPRDDVLLEPALLQALEGFADRDRVLVALDFDGVLSPLVDVPSDARPLPENADAVAALAALPRTDVALVSGRALADLRAVASPPPGALLVASHGAETDGVEALLDDAARMLLADVIAGLQAVVDAHPGTHIETKPAGAVLHTRRAARDVAAQATDAVLTGVARRPGVHTLVGKEMVELSVLDADKGTALAAMRDRLGVDAVLFAGDDTTDEMAFAVLRDEDVGVKVGEGATAARYRVRDCAQVAVLLEHLALLRR